MDRTLDELYQAFGRNVVPQSAAFVEISSFDWQKFYNPITVSLIRELYLKKGFKRLWDNMNFEEQEETMNSMARIINNLA